MRKAPWFIGTLFLSFMNLDAVALTKEQMDIVEQRFDQGDVKGGIVGLKRVLKKTPKDKEARYLLSKGYYLNGDIDSSDKELQRAKTLGLDNSYWMPHQANIYFQQQKFDKILEEFSTTTIQNTDISALWLSELNLVKAQALLSTQKIVQAREILLSVLVLHPSKVEALLGLTQSYLIEENVLEAEKVLQKIMRSSKLKTDLKLDAQVRVVQAAVFRMKNDLDSARISYLDALNLDQENLQARLGLVEMNLLMKNKTSFVKQAELLYEKAPKHALAIYYKALALYSQDKISEATTLLEKLTAVRTKHAPAILLLSYSYHKEKRYEMAAKTLEKYLELNPAHLGAKALLAGVMLQLKDPIRAVSLLEPLVEEAPHYEWLALLGHAYVIKGDLDKGIKALEKASSMMPQDPAIKLELAASLIANQQTPQATDVLDALLEQTDYVQADLLRLFVALKNQENDIALTIANQLVSKKPENPVFQNALGLALQANGDLVNAQKHFKLALLKAPKFMTAKINLAKIYIQEEKFKEAYQILDNSLKIQPNDLQALSLMSALAERQKKLKEAHKWLKTAQFRNPESFEAVTYLVGFYLRNQQLDKAYLEAKEALVKFPKNPQAKHLLGQLALHKNEFDKAYQVFDELNTQHPDNVQILNGLARSQLGLNKVSEAQVSLEDVLKQQQSNMSALLMSADIALSNHEYPKLKNLANKVIAKNNSSPIGYKLLADASLGLGEINRAESLYQKAYEKSGSNHYARAYYRALKYNEKQSLGFDLLETHLSKNPDHHVLRQYLATEYLIIQNNAKAKEHYIKVIDKNNSDYVSLNNLAHIYLQEGKINQAQKYAESAFKLAPELSEVADTYAWVLIRQKQAEKAIPILTAAIVRTPNSPQLRYHRAVGLYETGDNRSAIHELELVIASDETFPEKKPAKILLESIKKQG